MVKKYQFKEIIVELLRYRKKIISLSQIRKGLINHNIIQNHCLDQVVSTKLTSQFKDQKIIHRVRKLKKRQLNSSTSIPAIPSKDMIYGYQQTKNGLKLNQNKLAFVDRKGIKSKEWQLSKVCNQTTISKQNILSRVLSNTLNSIDIQHIQQQSKDFQNKSCSANYFKFRKGLALCKQHIQNKLEQFQSPGPGHYEHQKNIIRKIKKQKFQFFGSSSDRFTKIEKPQKQKKKIQIPIKLFKTRPKQIKKNKKLSVFKTNLTNRFTTQRNYNSVFNKLQKNLKSNNPKSRIIRQQYTSVTNMDIGPGQYDPKIPAYYQKQNKIPNNKDRFADNESNFISNLFFRSHHEQWKVNTFNQSSVPFNTNQQRFHVVKQKKEQQNQNCYKLKKVQMNKKQRIAIPFGSNKQREIGKTRQIIGPGKYIIRSKTMIKPSFNLKYYSRQ